MEVDILSKISKWVWCLSVGTLAVDCVLTGKFLSESNAGADIGSASRLSTIYHISIEQIPRQTIMNYALVNIIIVGNSLDKSPHDATL